MTHHKKLGVIAHALSDVVACAVHTTGKTMLFGIHARDKSVLPGDNPRCRHSRHAFKRAETCARLIRTTHNLAVLCAVAGTDGVSRLLPTHHGGAAAITYHQNQAHPADGIRKARTHAQIAQSSRRSPLRTLVFVSDARGIVTAPMLAAPCVTHPKISDRRRTAQAPSLSFASLPPRPSLTPVGISA